MEKVSSNIQSVITEFKGYISISKGERERESQVKLERPGCLVGHVTCSALFYTSSRHSFGPCYFFTSLDLSNGLVMSWELFIFFYNS